MNYIRKYDKALWERMISLLIDAFSEDPLFSFAFSGTSVEHMRRAMGVYFDFALRYTLQHGGLVTTPDQQGIVAWIPQQSFPPEPPDSVPEQADEQVIKRFMNHEETPEGIIAANANNFGYIWLMAVSESHRGRGYAGNLLEAAIAQIRAEGKTECWVSTENPANKNMYIRNGFRLFVEKESAIGIKTMVFMQHI